LDKEKTIQIKFSVDSEQYEKLEMLAKARELSVPQFCKLTSLQVKIQPAKTIVVEGEHVMAEEDIIFLKEVTDRYNPDNQFLRVDKEFNGRLNQYADYKLKESD
jgi:hypothetical protein